MQNRILLPFLLQLFNCQTFKKVFTPLKIGFKSRNKQTFAETTGTTQEIRLSRIYYLPQNSRFIYIKETALTYIFKCLYPYRQFTFQCIHCIFKLVYHKYRRYSMNKQKYSMKVPLISLSRQSPNRPFHNIQSFATKVCYCWSETQVTILLIFSQLSVFFGKVCAQKL